MADDHEHSEGHGGGGSHGGGGHGGGHGGGGGGHEEAHEGAPEWLISFADNVALMMGFFVVLLAMNMKPASSGASSGAESSEASSAAAAAASSSTQNDMLDFAIGIREAFNNPVSPDNPQDAALYRRMIEREAESQARISGKKGKEHDVESIRPSDYLGMGGAIAFDRNAVKLNAAGQAALKDLLKSRRGSRNIVQVRGHVSAAEAFDRPDRGMGLAWERAFAVAEALVEAGLTWNQIQIHACADSDRITPRAFDEAGQRSNQRVELIETDKTAPDFDVEPAKQSAEPQAGADDHGAREATESPRGPTPHAPVPAGRGDSHGTAGKKGKSDH